MIFWWITRMLWHLRSLDCNTIEHTSDSLQRQIYIGINKPQNLVELA